MKFKDRYSCIGNCQQYAIKFADDSLTLQSELEDSKIENILKKYALTGVPPVDRKPLFGDFTGMVDYHTALNKIHELESNFMLLPADVRLRFDNDPQNLITFLNDKSNREEAIKLGLVAKDSLSPSPDQGGADAPLGTSTTT